MGVLRALFAGGLGLAASFLVACGGGSSLLTSTDASKLNADLAQIQSAVDAKRCTAAVSAVNAFSNDISGLPGELNQTLRKDLTDGASNITDLVGRSCPVTAAPARTTTTRTTTTPSTSTATSTPTHTTTPPPTTTTPATTPTHSGTTSTPSSGGVGIGGSGTSGGTGPGNGGPGQ